MLNMSFSVLINFLLYLKFSNKNFIVNFDVHSQLMAITLREPGL